MRPLRWSKKPSAWVGFALVAATCSWVIPATGTLASAASSAREFDAPSGLAVVLGNLYVTNRAGNSVSVINPSNGSWITTYHGASYGFNQPSAVTTYGSNLFVANAAGSLTELRANNGALVRRVSGAKFGFVDPVAITQAGNLILVLNAGRASASTPVAGSITEINARSGALVRRVSGTRFAFDNPLAFSVSGPDVFVADEGSNAMTEVQVSNGALVRVVSQEGLSDPDGIAVEDGNVWIADSSINGATEITAATGAVVATVTDSDADYGFGQPSQVIAYSGNVYVMTPFSTSPMVTKLSATTGVPAWYMCNTNGPYYFSLLSAFAITGDNLWVASRSGANSQTPGASTGSLTELSLGDGSLIMTVPAPSATSTTTTSTTTTTTP